MQSGVQLGVDVDPVENDDPIGGFSQLAFSQNGENVTVLGEGPRDSVKFEWMVTPWSECSQSCGPDIGYRVNKFYFCGVFKRVQKLRSLDSTDSFRFFDAMVSKTNRKRKVTPRTFF